MLKHLFPTLLLAAFCLQTAAADLPETRKTERTENVARKYKKRTERPNVDSLNTNLCTIVSVYRENGFALFNLVFLPDIELSGDMKDFYVQDPATARVYPVKKVGDSHIVTRRTWNAGFQYVAVAFKGLPEEAELVNLHLPSLGTHFLGVHLEADGESRIARGPVNDQGEPASIVTEIITEEQVPEEMRDGPVSKLPGKKKKQQPEEQKEETEEKQKKSPSKFLAR